tara:strand:+ start:418 stop:642 length:225 start_codon:yes stop_codon:yes gene_type:complete
MPRWKDPMSYTKRYTIYSNNSKMNTSGYSNELPIEAMKHGGEIEVKRVGPIVQYKYGGVTYTNKEDEKTKVKHQ